MTATSILAFEPYSHESVAREATPIKEEESPAQTGKKQVFVPNWRGVGVGETLERS